ncbi:hypothetical protein [Pseudonocardia sp. MH-G8]|uniref:hypothetical protein n=1 Tax=Pseudonocardia sp. MH-G8 TaxID=1854588 RepID=UPI000BA0D77A|nr:hypothetical protein [Pseudonocardia sp. MH-G8]OZM77208.1 hypothetical protein CFP66_36905 [Pseudonocardia sp. MH-G8]
MSSDALRPGEDALADVHEGMRVVDSAGADVGTVELVKVGDPEAVTGQGQSTPGGLVEDLQEAFGGGEPQVPAQFAAQLMRVGFVKVDGKGLLDRDTYVPADQVASVTAGAVHLTVPGADLVPRA